MNIKEIARDLSSEIYVIPFKRAYASVFDQIKDAIKPLKKEQKILYLDELQKGIDNLYEEHKAKCINKLTCPHDIHYQNLFNNIIEIKKDVKNEKSWYQKKWIKIIGIITIIAPIIIATNNAFGLLDRIKDRNPKTILLDYESELSLYISQANQLSFHSRIKNSNEIALTKPKIQIIIHGFTVPKSYKPQNSIRLLSNDNIAKWNEEDSYSMPRIFFEQKIGSAGTFTSSPSFAEKAIYPNDQITLSETSIVYPFLDSIKYAIGQLDVRVLEGKRQTKYYLFEFEKNHNTKIIMETDQSDVNKLVSEFLSLKNL